ncbi:hypothetical protein RVN83_17035 [Streptomyces sp. PU10]|uniref:hypothetical protein n=1 Tax=Streptomyces TaxID=1883 RepID=UPI002852CD72|nr:MULTISPECIES: hypothetical protein [Streptomyces]MDU0254842.1 hypothetical protein [Streptomyces sp. PU10]WSU02740.1 hypothetical protein OG368_19890 [Streptomyces sp. NBC_01124]
MTLEHVSVAVLAAEIVLMLLARLGTERRHWRHRRRGGVAPRKRDDIRLGPGLVYSVAALALVVVAVFSGIDFEWDIGTLSLLGVLGVLVPGYAAHSVMLLGTHGDRTPLKGWQETLAYVLAALGGAAAVAFA